MMAMGTEEVKTQKVIKTHHIFLMIILDSDDSTIIVIGGYDGGTMVI